MSSPTVWEEIQTLPVFDTHTHLETSARVGATDFFDIAHYFWFRRELEAAGYPRNAEELPPAQRFAAFKAAYGSARNTAWAGMVRRMIRDLYQIDITDDDGPERADSAIRERADDAAWPQEVCRRVGIRRIVTGLNEPNDLARLGGAIHVVPVYVRRPDDIVERVRIAPNQRRAAEAVAREIESAVAELAEAGHRSVRVDWPFEGLGNDVHDPREPDSQGTSDETIRRFLGHRMLAAASQRRLHLQIFVGMLRLDGPAAEGEYRSTSGLSRSTSLDDPKRIVDMHDIFDLYPGIDFELINAAGGSALDIVQAARIYPNVYPGGLWWFNFRASTYRANMQYRLEALPAGRAPMVASDARHIEWAYTKVLFIKMLLAEFLDEQIAGGWIDIDTARFVARAWLHDAAADLYRSESEGETT